MKDKKYNNPNKKQFKNLIKKIASGEKDSLENFYTLYGKLIYTTALATTKSKQLADEIVDDILLKIWKRASTIKKIQNPAGWLYTLTVNSSRDKIKNEKQCLELFDIPQIDSNIEQVFGNDEFYHHIFFLNEFEQQIMIFRFIEDMSFEAIAHEVDKPLSTVTSVYYRALEKIKKRFS